jgi:hypothetical protein
MSWRIAMRAFFWFLCFRTKAFTRSVWTSTGFPPVKWIELERMDGDEGERDGTGRRRTEPREGRNSYGRGIEWMTPRNDRLGPYENEYVIA